MVAGVKPAAGAAPRLLRWAAVSLTLLGTSRAMDMERGYVISFTEHSAIMGTREAVLDPSNPEIAKLEHGVTYSAWIRYDDLNRRRIQPLLYIGSSSACCVFEPLAGGPGGYVFGSASPVFWDTFVTDPENWHHYVYSWNRTTGDMGIYIDGEQVVRDSISGGSIVDDGAFLVLGKQASSGYLPTPGQYLEINAGQGFLGQADDLALFAKALTADEVAATWNTSLTKRVQEGLEPDLVLFYNFNNNNGDEDDQEAVEPNLGTAGFDYDLLYGRVAKEDEPGKELSTRYLLIGPNLVIDMLAPDRTPTPLDASMWRHPWPAPRAVDPDAPYVVIAHAGTNFTILLDEGVTFEGVVNSTAAYLPPPEIEVGGSTVNASSPVHVLPLVPPRGPRTTGGNDYFLLFPTAEDESVSMRFASSGVHRVEMVIDSLPARGELSDGAASLNGSLDVLDARVTALTYQPEEDGFGTPFDQVRYHARLAQFPNLRSPEINLTINVDEVNDLPRVTSHSVQLKEDSVGAEMQLSFSDAELDSPVGAVITRLPSRGKLFYRDSGGDLVEFKAEYNPYTVGKNLISQYLDQVTGVSSFYHSYNEGNPIYLGYHAANILGPPQCSTFGECEAFLGDVPEAGTRVLHPPFGLLATVLSSTPLVSGDVSVRISYHKMYKQVNGEWVRCHMDPLGSRRHPQDCDESLVPSDSDAEVTATVLRSALGKVQGAVWTPLVASYSPGTVLSYGGGVLGEQFAFNHVQNPEQDGYTEWIEATIAQPVYVVSVEVGSPRGMGMVVGIKVRESPASQWMSLYKAEALPSESEKFSRNQRYWAWEAPVCRTLRRVSHIRIEIDTQAVADWNYIDYVKVVGTLDIQDGAIPASAQAVVYVPDDDKFGDDFFKYSATDCPGAALRAAAVPGTVDLSVAGVNDPPSAQDMTVAVTVGAAPLVVELDISDLDSDRRALTVEVITLPGHCEVTPVRNPRRISANGSALVDVPERLGEGVHHIALACSDIRSAPNATGSSIFGFVAPLSFEYRVLDPRGLSSDPATVFIEASQRGTLTRAQLSALVISMPTVGGLLLCCFVMHLARIAWVRRKKAILTRIRQEREDRIRVIEAAMALTTLSYPAAFVSLHTLKRMQSLPKHETLRDSHQLHILDNYGEFLEWKAGTHTVFLSHQWLGFREPDPNGEHLAAAVQACELLCKRKGIRHDKLFVWFDYCSIPQNNARLQRLAVDTLAVYASLCTHFISLCPDSRHTDLGLYLGAESYKARGWCRMEMWSRLMVEGTADMYLYRNSMLQPVSSIPDYFGETIYIYEGNFTNAEDDKPKLVDVCLGVWAVTRIRQRREDPVLERNLERVRSDMARVFPPLYFEGLSDVADKVVSSIDYSQAEHDERWGLNKHVQGGWNRQFTRQISRFFGRLGTGSSLESMHGRGNQHIHDSLAEQGDYMAALRHELEDLLRQVRSVRSNEVPGGKVKSNKEGMSVSARGWRAVRSMKRSVGSLTGRRSTSPTSLRKAKTQASDKHSGVTVSLDAVKPDGDRRQRSASDTPSTSDTTAASTVTSGRAGVLTVPSLDPAKQPTPLGRRPVEAV